MAKQRKYCEASIARVYSEHVRGTENVSSSAPISLETCCVRNQRCKQYTETDVAVSDILRELVRESYNGTELPLDVWTVSKRAKIGGVGFTSGTPLTGVRRSGEKTNRCGSVVTIVRAGQSLYGRVISFISFDRLHVAHIEWLPIPDYPTGTPVVCRLVRGGRKPDQPCVVSLTDLDPSKVIILHERTCMYMIRMSGINTMPRT